jgi:hypothetical protein
VIGLTSVALQFRKWGPVAVYFLTYTVIFCLSGVIIFPWYLVPAEFAAVFLYALALAGPVATLIKRIRWSPVRSFGPWPIVAILVATSVVLLNGTKDRYAEVQRFEEGVRKQIGLWFKQNADPGALIFLEPLGYVGYYAGIDRRCVDEIGLVSSQVLRARGSGNGWYMNALKAVHPEYIVQYTYALERNTSEGTADPLFITLQERAWFDARYSRITEFDVRRQYPTIAEKEKAYTVFRRISSAPWP